MDWLSVFDEACPDPGASHAEIERFVATVGQPLSGAEIEAVNLSQQNPFPKSDPLYAAYRPFDPSAWVMPSRPLPPQYLAFLRWSNGGWFRSGQREFGFFPVSDATGGVRPMMVGNNLPQYIPGALPFAFNGGGTFYLFDMRGQAVRGEYPVVCSHAGNLGWRPDQGCLVADTFEAVCRGKVNVDELRWRAASSAER